MPYVFLKSDCQPVAVLLTPRKLISSAWIFSAAVFPLPRSSPTGVGAGVADGVGSGVAVGVGVGVAVGVAVGRGLPCAIGDSARQLSVTEIRKKACRGSGRLFNFPIWRVFIPITKGIGKQSSAEFSGRVLEHWQFATLRRRKSVAMK